MLALSAIFFVGMYYALNKILFEKEFSDIQEQSNEAIHYISVDNGIIKIVGNYIQNFIDHGGFAAVYDSNGKLMAGKLPNDAIFPKEKNLNNTAITVNSYDSKIKYILIDTELLNEYKAYGWLRLVTIQHSEKALNSMIQIFVIVVPIYIGFAVLGGLLLINKALSPISKIISTAKKICIGNLSSRVGVINRKDEVGQLAHSIDDMMDTIESAYNRQKQFENG